MRGMRRDNFSPLRIEKLRTKLASVWMDIGAAPEIEAHRILCTGLRMTAHREVINPFSARPEHAKCYGLDQDDKAPTTTS